MYDYPATSTNMSGFATAAGATPAAGNGGMPWPGFQSQIKRYALMPTKGKNWAKSKKDMRWDPKFCGPDKRIRRLLMVEYCKTEILEAETGRRFVKMDAKATECSDMESIEDLCKLERGDDVILRVLYDCLEAMSKTFLKQPSSLSPSTGCTTGRILKDGIT